MPHLPEVAWDRIMRPPYPLRMSGKTTVGSTPYKNLRSLIASWETCRLLIRELVCDVVK